LYRQWGVPLEATDELVERLDGFFRLYARTMRTQTRDTSAYGKAYLSGVLRMEQGRTMAGISRQTKVNEQAMQHFISQSPWAASSTIQRMQAEIAIRPELHEGAMLLLDESGDEHAGKHTVGAARQYLGRLGKVDMGQVGVFVSLVKGSFWAWVDGELYLPEVWFSEAYAAVREQVGVPTERTFASKAQLGLPLIDRVRGQEVPFEAVGCDTFYGRDGWFRAELAQRDLDYMADVPASQRVYLNEPSLGLPAHSKGPKAQHERVVAPKAYRVDRLRDEADTRWQTLTLRNTERGELTAEFAARRVWTVWQDDQSEYHRRQEWLVLRRDRDGKCYYALSNASVETPLTLLATRKCQRFFIERANQDAKSELGWDEIQTTKFLAWQHHLALTILAAWFIAETKLDWGIQFARDPDLLAHYQVEVLPALSVANVRALLRAALPLPQLSPSQATDLVIKHLVNRVHSRKSRLKNRFSP
jgi:SRSO17 transposase